MTENQTVNYGCIALLGGLTSGILQYSGLMIRISGLIGDELSFNRLFIGGCIYYGGKILRSAETYNNLKNELNSLEDKLTPTKIKR